jgi:hypothetical protein
MADPAARIPRTRWVNRQPRYSLISWRMVFRQCARSARSSTSASPGRRDCETAWLQELQGGRTAPLHEQLAGRLPRLEGSCSAQVTAAMRWLFGRMTVNLGGADRVVREPGRLQT